MARLHTDLEPVRANQPLDLHDRRVEDPNMPMSASVINLNQPSKPAEPASSQFFFEFLPAALDTPAAIRPFTAAALDKLRRLRVTTRQVVIGLALLLLALLVSLNATRRPTEKGTTGPTPAAQATESNGGTSATPTPTTSSPTESTQPSSGTGTSSSSSGASRSNQTGGTNPAGGSGSGSGSPNPPLTATTPTKDNLDPSVCLNVLGSICGSVVPPPLPVAPPSAPVTPPALPIH